jgi:uncharacterized protein (TIGR00297 family)
VEVGTDGAISILGTAAGLGAAALIALIAIVLDINGLPLKLFGIATLSGFLGTTVDSFLGATLEREGVIGNELVNLGSIGTSFLISIVLYLVVV